MHELWALENEGLRLLQHTVCPLVVMCQVDTDTAIHIFRHMNEEIWIITTRQLRVYVTLLFPYFSHPYFIKAMEAHIGQHISQATEMQTLCWCKTRTSFSGAHNSYSSWPINTIFVPRIGMYIRINIPKMDFIYLKIWCNSVIFCEKGYFFWLTLYKRLHRDYIVYKRLHRDYIVYKRLHRDYTLYKRLHRDYTVYKRLHRDYIVATSWLHRV